MAHLYYVDGLPAERFEPGSCLDVRGEEGRHAVRVSRLRPGERIGAGNGSGAIGFGEVIGIGRDEFTVRLEQVEHRALPDQSIVLVQALAKGDRDERAVEQCTEFGVDAIVPWQAERSVSRWGNAQEEKAKKGVAKWMRVAREASKQAMRAHVPDVRTLVSTGELCRLAGDPTVSVLVLHPDGERRLTEWLAGDAARSSAEIFVVIGPEGGLDASELASLSEAGADVLMIGETVLRTSSAGPAAVALLNSGLGRW